MRREVRWQKAGMGSACRPHMLHGRRGGKGHSSGRTGMCRRVCMCVDIYNKAVVCVCACGEGSVCGSAGGIGEVWCAVQEIEQRQEGASVRLHALPALPAFLKGQRVPGSESKFQTSPQPVPFPLVPKCPQSLPAWPATQAT